MRSFVTLEAKILAYDGSGRLIFWNPEILTNENGPGNG